MGSRSSLGEAILDLGADDSRLQSDVQAAGSAVQGILGGFARVFAGILGAISIGALVGTIATGIVGIEETFGDAYDAIMIRTGETGDALEGLREDFRAVFTSVPADAQDVADVIGALNTRLGYTGDTLQGVSGNVLEMSRMLGGDATTNAELFSRVVGDWSVSNEDAAGTLDMIFVASQQTGVGVDRLMQQVVQFGSPMRLMGFEIEDAIALFGRWEQQGVNAELVMGSLRIAAGNFAREGVDLREGLLGTIETIQGMESSSEALALGMEVFGARAGPDMVAAIREGRFEIEDLIGALENADGAIMSTSWEVMGAAEKFEVLRNRAMLAIEPIATRVMDLASNLLDTLTPAFDWLVEKIDQYVVPVFDTLADSFEMLMSGDIAGAIGNIFGDGIGADVGGIVDQIGGIWNALLTGDTDAAGGLLANLIGPDAADGIMAAFTSIQTGWGNLIAFFQGNGPGILDTVVTLFGTIFSQIGAFVSSQVVPFLAEQFERVSAWFVENGPLIQEFLQALATLWTEHILPAIIGAWSFIQPILSGIIDLVLGIVRFIMQLATGDWPGAWETIKATVVNAGAAIWEAIVNFLDWIASLFGGSLAEIGATWSQNWENFKSIVSAIWEIIKGVFVDAWASITETVQNIVDSIVAFFTTGHDWGEIGRNIMEGIAAGIEDAIDWLLGTVTEVGQEVFDAIADLFGIESPSRLFHDEIGWMMGAGLLEGFDDSLRQLAIPTINARLESTDWSVPSAVIGTGTGAISQGPSYSFVNNISNAGVDADELERIQRRQELLYAS